MNRDCNCILTRPLQPSLPTRDPQANVSWEDGKTQPPGAIDGIGPDKFVEFFRQASPYIVNHHGSVMVVVIPGEVFIAKDVLQGIVQDVALLQSLGVRVVLVLGSNKQVEEGLVDRGIGSEVVDGYRVTSPEALEVAMEAAGRNSVLVQALLSRGINVAVTRRHGDRAAGNGMNGGFDSGMGVMGGGMNAGGTNSMNEFNGNSMGSGSNFGGYDSRTSVGSPTGVSGNFIQAKRRGVVKGLDFQYTGDVVSVDVNAVRMRLAMGDVVLLSSLGFNAAGEVLNCQAYDVAVSVAIDIGADKLVSYLSPGDMPRNESGERMKYMPLSVAEDYIMDVARRGLELSPGQSSGQLSSADADSADDAAAWSAETMEAVGGSAEALPLPPPAGERDADGWMLDSWRWLQDGMGTDGGLHGLHDPNRLGSSPWQRLTERGLQWRVEGCPQEVCAAVFSCKGWRPQGAFGGLHRAGRSSVGAVHVRRRGRDGEQGSVRRDAARQARGLDPHQEHPGTPGEGRNHGGDERRGVD
jgi:amino-acid N-acetyltransferase